ncbi:xanthine dehydrogenase [Pseudomonas aeruginosa]|nr:xanthine dehydrogenase [Pseudomonas aeruginosa]
MGQGLNTKVAQVVAEVFQVDIDRIQITATNTDKVPNTSPTAASSGTDLNGKAAQNAAETIKRRLVEFAARHWKVSEEDIEFRNNQVRIRELILPFEDLVQQAYFGQVSLSSTGFYRTPKIFYDREQARGRPFYYFAYGAACSEVIVDTLTGEYRMLRTDILHDVGDSLNPAIDIGQVEGGFVQGMGWLTMEELVWNANGKLMTSGPASYKIPAVADMPLDLRVKLVENCKNPEQTVFHSRPSASRRSCSASRSGARSRTPWPASPTTVRNPPSTRRRRRAGALGRGTDAPAEDRTGASGGRRRGNGLSPAIGRMTR